MSTGRSSDSPWTLTDGRALHGPDASVTRVAHFASLYPSCDEFDGNAEVRMCRVSEDF